MALSVFPVPVTTSSSGARSITVPSPNVPVGATVNIVAGTYLIECISTTNATIEFLSTTGITSGTTVSGSLTINVPSDATGFTVFTNTGTNVVVTITLKAENVVNSVSLAALQTITNSQTYTQNSTSGYAYVVVVGGGGRGSNLPTGNSQPGGGGGSGGVASGIVRLTGSLAITIGASGTGFSGGATTVGNISANGGGFGFPGGTGTPGSPGGGGGGAGGTNAPGSAGGASQQPTYAFVKTGTTGGGGGGGANGGGAGGGSGIGTGSSGSTATRQSNASGFGAGGGGSIFNTTNPDVSLGTAGVAYIARF